MKLVLLLKARAPKHPLNTPYTQPSGRIVMRTLDKKGKVKIVPVKKGKKKPAVKTAKPAEATSSGYGFKIKESVHSIPLSKIEAAEGGQIRKKFGIKALETLAASIEAGGLGQPIIVRPHPTKKGKYEIVAGERRYRAHKMLHSAGKTALNDEPGEIRAVIRDYADDSKKDAMQMIENTVRENNTPMELGNAIKAAFDKGESFEDIARARGQRIDYVKNHYSLTTLHPDIQTMIEKKEMPKKAGFLLAELPESEQQVFAGKFIREGWSVRTLDNHIFNFKNQQKLFEAGAEKTDEMKAAEAALLQSGKTPQETNEMIRGFVNKWSSFIDKFVEEGGPKLSALGLMASGTLDQNMKLFEMLTEKMQHVFSQMKATHYDMSAPSMFAKSINTAILDRSRFAELQRDFSILKSILKYRKKNAT